MNLGYYIIKTSSYLLLVASVVGAGVAIYGTVKGDSQVAQVVPSVAIGTLISGGLGLSLLQKSRFIKKSRELSRSKEQRLEDLWKNVPYKVPGPLELPDLSDRLDN